MRQTRILMGMPISVEIVDHGVPEAVFDDVFDYFRYVDEKFSTYKKSSEITSINEGRLDEKDWSSDMRLIFDLSEKTKEETDGYFDIKNPLGICDPSGIVKGWSIFNAAKILKEKGVKNFYVDAGGDIQPNGNNAGGDKWSVGVKNPFNEREIIKVIYVSDEGVATSGTYIRGLHIYNPKDHKPMDKIVSLTVIGPNVYEADRFATAAFAMGLDGINFIEKLPGFEGYIIDKGGVATMTTGFNKYTTNV
jgi:thiamine biosynthesis lipoprotein